MFNLKDELKDIEEGLTRESLSSSSSSFSTSRELPPSILARIEDHFVKYDPVSQETKLKILREKIIEWENGNDLLKLLAQKLQLLLAKLTAENRFVIFEEYRRLSYALNDVENLAKYPNLKSQISKAEDGSGYDFDVTAPDNEGNSQRYLAKKIDTTNDDLVPFVLIPKNESEALCEIKLTFQGTSSFNGWYRNLTGRDSAGINELNANKVIIVFELMQEIKKIKGDRNINLTIIGHSLGGADAQNMMVALMEAIYDEYIAQKTSSTDPELGKIKKLNLYVYNSAGVNEDTKEKSLCLARELKELGIEINANFSIVGGDLVQQTGMTNIFVGLSQECVNFTLIKTHCKREGRYDSTSIAHTGEFFTKNGVHIKHLGGREYFFNDTREDISEIVRKCQMHKLASSARLIYLVAQLVKIGIKSVGKKVFEGNNGAVLLKIAKKIIENQEYFLTDFNIISTRNLIKELLLLQPELISKFFFNGDNPSFFSQCIARNYTEIIELLFNKSGIKKLIRDPKKILFHSEK